MLQIAKGTQGVSNMTTPRSSINGPTILVVLMAPHTLCLHPGERFHGVNLCEARQLLVADVEPLRAMRDTGHCVGEIRRHR